MHALRYSLMSSSILLQHTLPQWISIPWHLPSTQRRKTVISAYFRAVATLPPACIPSQPASALLSAASSGKASIFALFGGQRTNEVYFDELQNLYNTYTPFVAPFLQTATQDILIPLAEEEADSTFYAHGLDVVSWLSGATPRPAVSYLASVAVSFPLIGLTQLVQYLIVCHVANFETASLVQRVTLKASFLLLRSLPQPLSMNSPRTRAKP